MKYVDSKTTEKYFESRKNCINENTNDYKGDFLYVSLKPKFKWFRPPLAIKIFKWSISLLWAYKIDKEYILKDVYPSSIPSDFEYTGNGNSHDIEFRVNKKEDN